MHTLEICHLYPDILNIYGDRGNIISLVKRAEWRGITVNVHNITLGEAFDSSEYDVVFLGGGQDFEQEIIHKDFIKQKGNEIVNAITGSKVFLCVCGGYQMMGKYYKTSTGKEIEFLGALDLWSIAGKNRMVGNASVEFISGNTDESGFTIVGFENHSGRTYLGNGVKPLGKVLKGYGNNGEDGFEGAVYNNVYCSYLHGSLLPKNPKLTDLLLLTALRNKYKDYPELQELDDRIETAAHNAALNRNSEGQ
ncbi:MAG: glutamine amidotransferase [Eubacteriales bacterium]|nr:glutamine amidotransferase [Eubacteriales bacterium]